MRRVDDLEAADLETVLAGDGGNLRARADEDRNDDAGLRRLDRAAQRSLVAGMHDDGGRGRHLLRPRDEPVVFRVGRIAERTDRRDGADFAVFLR